MGGTNASLGELFTALKPKGVGVLDGFAITTDAYWRLLEEQGLRGQLEKIFLGLDSENLEAACCERPRGPDANPGNTFAPSASVLDS